MSDTKTEVTTVSKEDLSLISDNTLNERQLGFLLAKTPPTYIHQRQGKGGIFSYVTGGYMKKVLNLMFGWNWDFEVEESQVINDQIVVLGKLTCRVDVEVQGEMTTKSIVKMQYGGKDIAYKKGTKFALDIGNDFKAASTDALKKCASELGIAADIYNSEEFKEVKVASEENPNIGESESITKGVEDALKKVQGDTVEESVEIPPMKEAAVPNTVTVVTEEVVEIALPATGTGGAGTDEGSRIITGEGAPGTEEPVGGEFPPTETNEMSKDQQASIMELLKADDFPDGYVDNVMKELDSFDTKRAENCIDFISAKKYLPEQVIPPTEEPKWNPEWLLYTEAHLKEMGTAEGIYKIITQRSLVPEKKNKTNKLLRDLILNHQKEVAPKDAEAYIPPTEEPEIVTETIAVVENDEEDREVLKEVVEASEGADSIAVDAAIELMSEGTTKERVAEILNRKDAEPKAEETPVAEEKVPEEAPATTKEVEAPIDIVKFEKELSGIEVPPVPRGTGEYKEVRKIWELLGKYGATDEKTTDVLKTMKLPDTFVTREDVARFATEEQIIEFVQHLKS